MHIRRVLFALALSLVSLTIAAQQVRYAMPMDPVTVSELPALDPNAEEPRREIDHRRHRPLELFLAAPLSFDDRAPVATATIAPPKMRAAFSASDSGFLAPSDASGAVGKEYVVAATNAGLLIQDRAGAVLKGASLFTFLGEGISGTGVYYDPRIAYDAAADRWIVIGNNDRSSGVYMILAISQTGDPRGTWTRYRLEIGDFPGIDFSRLALSRDTVMIGTQLAEVSKCYIVSIRKSDLYAAPASLPTKQYSFVMYDVAPVQADDVPFEYVVHNNFSNQIQVKQLDEPAWRSVEKTITWSQNTAYAPQQGTTNKLDTGFLYPIENAVYRNGSVYVVHSGNRGGRSAIIWWKINPDTGARLDSGTIEDPAGEKYYAYPSLAVNRLGAMVIGFSTFSSKTYPSAGYVYRDPNGNLSTTAELKTGEGSFLWSDRWGDYTTTVMDPLNDHAFWTLQIISLNNRWQTWWGKIELEPGRRRSARH